MLGLSLKSVNMGSMDVGQDCYRIQSLMSEIADALYVDFVFPCQFAYLNTDLGWISISDSQAIPVCE